MAQEIIRKSDEKLIQSIANERRTIGMNGSGFTKMFARQMVADLKAIRNSIGPEATRIGKRPIHLPV